MLQPTNSSFGVYWRYKGQQEEVMVTAVLDYKTNSRAARPKVPSGLYLLAVNIGGREATRRWMNLHGPSVATRRREGPVLLGRRDAVADLSSFQVDSK